MATTESMKAQALSDTRLKAAHARMWALGDYPSAAKELVTELGEVLVKACEVTAADRVLDVAAGAGNAAATAARTGARVVAADLTPELLAAGRTEHGDAEGRLTWEQADAEALPYPDASFDVVMSCIGAMFAPHHERTAAELTRVLRPGGRLGLISWTPTGFIGQMFAVKKPYLPPTPPGTSPAMLWGDPDHVRDLLGDSVVGFTAERRMLPVHRFADGAEFRDYFKSNYGPTVAVYRSLADHPDDTATLDAGLENLAAAALDSGGGMEWEYLLVTGHRR